VWCIFVVDRDLVAETPTRLKTRSDAPDLCSCRDLRAYENMEYRDDGDCCWNLLERTSLALKTRNWHGMTNPAAKHLSRCYDEAHRNRHTISHWAYYETGRMTASWTFILLCRRLVLSLLKPLDSLMLVMLQFIALSII
jgi:hypothetical protein